MQASKPMSTAKRPGHLASLSGRPDLELQVLRSGAGFYIGTFDDEEGPYTRESLEYFRKREEAEHALAGNAWTQRTSL